ncbi:MAG TPA: hypothetical protein VKG44_00170, partial [Candidatus Baltobacteraceae bacterium]|nr:hypothetical protein [Candidatus Baltobacteraceae bacterium]
LSEAIRIGTEALELHRESESPKWSGALLGPLAEWSALRGDLQVAREHVEQMLTGGQGAHAEWPQRFHWSAAQVLHACGEHGLARGELERAHALFAQFAGELEGPDLAYYESALWNRAIVAAFERDEWPNF